MRIAADASCNEKNEGGEGGKRKREEEGEKGRQCESARDGRYETGLAKVRASWLTLTGES